MSVWASDMSRQAQDGNGDKIKGMVEVYADATSDANGEFEVDLTPLDLVEVLDATAIILGQTLDAVDDITTKVLATVYEISNTIVRGAVVQPTSTTVNVLGTDVAAVERGPSGQNVKVKVMGRR